MSQIGTALLLFVYTLAAFGFAYVLGRSRVSLPIRIWIEPPRELVRAHWVGRATDLLRTYALDLIECPACLGFWVGLGIGLGQLGLSCFDAACLGFYTVGTNYVLARATGLMPGAVHFESGEVKDTGDGP